MDDGARAAYEAEVALLSPEWVAQVRREAAGPAPFGERLRKERVTAERALGSALAVLEGAGNLTAVWIAARAQGVDLPATAAQLRQLRAGLQALAALDRRSGRPPRLARALALAEMAELWRRHGLGPGDAQDRAFMDAAVGTYLDLWLAESTDADVREAIRDDFRKLSDIES